MKGEGGGCEHFLKSQGGVEVCREDGWGWVVLGRGEIYSPRGWGGGGDGKGRKGGGGKWMGCVARFQASLNAEGDVSSSPAPAMWKGGCP